ncbi:MAG: DUF3108 domain-containing protein [Fibrobacter sp.]|nr:DUF3108 domain-containing protein [Fibrobacter sp.]
MFISRSIFLHRTALSALASLILFSFTMSASAEEEIKWQDASKEVDNFLFKPDYIDSVRNLNNVSGTHKSLRYLEKRIPCEAETLVYDVAWGPFKAGYVVLTVEPDVKNRIIRLGGKALSNNFVGAFYRMRDYVMSTIDADGIYPLFFEQHLREGKKYKADGYILYDHETGKTYVQEKKFRSLETPQFIHDYISILYYIRTMQIAPGDTFSLNLFIHSKVHPIFFKCKERMEIKVDAGTFKCILLEPKLAGEGRAFNKKDKLEVWMTDDEYKIPVLIKSKIKFGTINAKLIWKSGRNSAALPPG